MAHSTGNASAATAQKTNQSGGRRVRQLRTYHFLTVADLGPNADYQSAVVRSVELGLHFCVSRRTSIELLRFVQGMIRHQLNLRFNHGPIHIWLVDESGNPTFFLSGQLSVANGDFTRKDATSLGNQIYRQLNRANAIHQLHLLVRAVGEVFHTVCEDGELEEINSEQYTYFENEVIAEHFSDFQHCDVIDSEFGSNGGSIWVMVEGWRHLTLHLPFTPTTKTSAPQLQHAVDVALDTISQLVTSEVDLDSDNHDIWLIEQGKAVLNLSQLLMYRERRCSYSDYRKAVRQSLHDLPSLAVSHD
jgi:hypothetical protein